MSALLDALAGQQQGDLADRFDAAAGASAGVGLGEQADADTPTTDVVRGAAPVNDPDKANNGFAGFFNGLGGALNRVTEIELQRYAQDRLGGGKASGSVSTQQQAQQQAAGAAGGMGKWVLIGGAVLVVGVGLVIALRR